MSKRKKVPSIDVLYKQVSKNVLHPNTSFTYELWYSRLLGRRFSIYFTWVFLHTKLTPNHVTLLSLVPALVGTFFLVYPQIWSLILGFIIFNLYIIIDSSDGEMARYYKKTSSFGHYMDGILHVLIYSSLYISIGFNIFLRTNNIMFLILGFATSLSSTIGSFIFHTDPEMDRGNNYLETRGQDNKILFYGTNLYNFITNDLNIFLLLVLLGPLQYRNFISVDLFSIILVLNFFLTIFGGIVFQFLKKYKVNN